MLIQIQHRRDIEANWISSNPILAAGEIGIATDVNKIKIGNGTSTWTQLSYYTFTGDATLLDTANPVKSPNFINGYETTVTSSTPKVLTVNSAYQQFFTGSTAQKVTLPVVSTMRVLGQGFYLNNNSTANITVNSSGGNLVATILPNTTWTITCISLSGTGSSSWDADFSGATSVTGTGGSVVLSTSPSFNGAIYIGDGIINSTPGPGTVQATSGSGTNINGASLNLSAGQSTGTGLSGNIGFFTSVSGTSGTSLNSLVERMHINSVGNIGIGTTSPSALLHLKGADGAATTINIDSYGAGIPQSFRRADGTSASPTAVASSDALGQFFFEGYDGSSYRNAAAIRVDVDGTPGSSNMPGRIVFLTSPSGTATLNERMRIDNSGNVGIGVTGVNAKLAVPASTTSTASLNIPHGSAPTSPNNGDIWTATTGVYARVNGSTTLLAPTTSPTFTTPTLGIASATSVIMGYTSTVTSSTPVVLTSSSTYQQFFTGSTVQSLNLPVTSTMVQGQSFYVNNNSSAAINVYTSNGTTLVTTINGNSSVYLTCLDTSAGNTNVVASWDVDFTGDTNTTGSGSVVLSTSPTFSTGFDAGSTFTALQTPTTLTLGSGATSFTLGGTPTTSLNATIFGNATASSVTKTLNIGTGGASGSITNILIGSSVSGATGTTTLNNNADFKGLMSFGGSAPTIASATTIAPTTKVVFISGTTAIATITAPSPISTSGGRITLIPTGLFTTTTAGNIALASTAVVSKALIMTYDPTTAKWYPSY
jgi:hypothetical protein